ncbi:hypothetical protein K469DRAFT_207072 [Zopfia rhizophila CBS 207.26]|uniref:Uncharacterized protein n=1 Tax=Zopfia rhizophila CBS 207.26 TaxID=1314779 RepID=A0A6A6DVP3_9PEZI|nr:hypothetical protein K469DRAFT_207072 [Zopfia rhizophila CBS 207.26]
MFEGARMGMFSAADAKIRALPQMRLCPWLALSDSALCFSRLLPRPNRIPLINPSLHYLAPLPHSMATLLRSMLVSIMFSVDLRWFCDVDLPSSSTALEQDKYFSRLKISFSHDYLPNHVGICHFTFFLLLSLDYLSSVDPSLHYMPDLCPHWPEVRAGFRISSFEASVIM